MAKIPHKTNRTNTLHISIERASGQLEQLGQSRTTRTHRANMTHRPNNTHRTHKAIRTIRSHSTFIINGTNRASRTR